MKLKSTVVLTTYNGSKYILDLLDSLKNQTRSIDEVLIFDDISTDSTVDLVKHFITDNNLDNWKLCINEQNKGWMKNFRDGILIASNDVIFPCDQDDIWFVEKIEIMMRIMESNEKVQLLSSDYKPLYETGGAKVDSFDKNEEVPVLIPFDEQFSMHKRPGCVMAVRKSFTRFISGIWKEDYPHDAFMWVSSCVCEGCYLLNKPLIYFRRHGNNTSSINGHRSINNQIKLMEMGESIVNWYKTSRFYKSNTKELIKNYYVWVNLRKCLLRTHNIFCFFKLHKYKKYYRSERQRLGDLYLVVRG